MSINKLLLEHSHSSFIYTLPMAIMAKLSSCDRKYMVSAKPKMFMLWPFIGKICWILIYTKNKHLIKKKYNIVSIASNTQYSRIFKMCKTSILKIINYFTRKLRQTNKYKDISCSWNRRLNIVNTSILPKLIFGFNTHHIHTHAHTHTHTGLFAVYFCKNQQAVFKLYTNVIKLD